MTSDIDALRAAIVKARHGGGVMIGILVVLGIAFGLMVYSLMLIGGAR